MARFFSPHPRKKSKSPSNFGGLVRSFLFLSQSDPEQLLVSVARTEIKKSLLFQKIQRPSASLQFSSEMRFCAD